MQIVPTTAAILVCATAALSQGPIATYISPVGAEFFEGNSASDIMLGNWNPQTRTQQVDNNLVGQTLPLLRFIGWRRNGVNNVGLPKVTTLTVIMSHADFNTVTSTFATNYKDAPVTVFTQKPVNLPDWSVMPGPAPAPFDVILPFDVPFLYNRVDALLYDVLNENNPQGIYTQDWVASMPHVYGGYSTNLGGSCTTPNGPMVHRNAMRTSASTFEMGFKVSGAPSSASLTLFLDIADPNVSFPGLCGVLHAQPLVSLNIGTATAAGELPLAYPVSLPWNPSWAGAAFFTQVVTADPSQAGLPIALSNGLSSPLPTSNTIGTAPIQVKRIYHTSSTTSPTGTGPSVSAVPTLYGI